MIHIFSWTWITLPVPKGVSNFPRDSLVSGSMISDSDIENTEKRNPFSTLCLVPTLSTNL